MNIEEMHVTFREMGQQMGMQTTRAIYSEDIDICLNAAILNKVKEIVISNLGVVAYRDKVAQQAQAITPINALRTLYTLGTVQDTAITGEGTEVNPYKLTISNKGVMLFTGFQVSYNGKTIYDCRIIEIEKLGQTLRDFCNRAAKDAPIIVVYNGDDNITGDIYTGRTNPTKPKLVKYMYIKEPAKVHYDEDDVGSRVDCDLPVYLHTEIVADAVRIYLASIGAVANDNNRNVQQ